MLCLTVRPVPDQPEQQGVHPGPHQRGGMIANGLPPIPGPEVRLERSTGAPELVDGEVRAVGPPRPRPVALNLRRVVLPQPGLVGIPGVPQPRQPLPGRNLPQPRPVGDHHIDIQSHGVRVPIVRFPGFRSWAAVPRRAPASRRSRDGGRRRGGRHAIQIGVRRWHGGLVPTMSAASGLSSPEVVYTSPRATAAYIRHCCRACLSIHADHQAKERSRLWCGKQYTSPRHLTRYGQGRWDSCAAPFRPWRSWHRSG